MSLTLLDWRRRVAALYAAVRAADSPAAGHALWVQGRDDLLARHPDSPLAGDARSRFRSVPMDDYVPDLRFEVDIDTAVEPLALDVPTSTDGVIHFDRIGRAGLGELGTLDVWWLGSYGGGVFVPVKDPSPDTYGGGRYLLDTVKSADLGGDARDGRLVLDLNFAYNPSCAYDPAWTCPLAPAGNALAVPVRGGERYRSGLYD